MERKPKIQVPRGIMCVIYNQPWEMDVPRLRLQMRSPSVGCPADAVCVPQLREGRAVDETDSVTSSGQQ